VKFRKGQSGNPGGRPKVLGDVQELARQHALRVIVELARLALKAKSETARIAAIRELLDRGYGRPRQAMEVSVPAGDPLKLLLDEIDSRSRIEAPVSHTSDRSHLSRLERRGINAPQRTAFSKSCRYAHGLSDYSHRCSRRARFGLIEEL
jgi:hypothetical protein